MQFGIRTSGIAVVAAVDEIVDGVAGVHGVSMFLTRDF